MKKFAFALLALPLILSCMLYANPELGELDFPLKKVLELPIEGAIEKIAVADTWIAVDTHDTIVAIDINTQETLWSMKMRINDYGESYKMINNVLFVASQDQIILIDRQGRKKEISLEPNGDTINIIKVASVYPDYLYVIRGSNWILEVYDISQNILLWRMSVGRGIGGVYYSSEGVVYVTTNDSLRAFDNLSGKLLCEVKGVFGFSTFKTGVLYVHVGTSNTNHYRILAMNMPTQEKLWEKDIVKPPNYNVSNLTIIDNLLVLSGDGMIAIDTANGEQVWTAPSVGEEFYAVPVEFDGVIYAKGLATGTVYAISPADGTIVGHVRLEDIGFDTASGGVYALKDGIMFNTKNDIVIYKAK